MSDRYEIREQIGKGGLGAVYKAFDTQLQREVAIKRVLSPDQATEEEVEEAARKLIAEAQTLSTLNHPNIITVFDVGKDDEGGFVVMELLKGETLDETIERGVLTQSDFTEVVYQTMEALIAAQASNVIHRDIKPTNIMVIWQASGKFQLKILDFGLAKFSKNPSVQTMDQEESVLGSIFFMAPEQFERGELDARTDIYQMGCVYYNALTGQYPFNGDTAPQVMNAHLQHKVVPLDQVRPDLPPAICQWVMWLINRDISHRPEDAREALKRWPKNPDPAGKLPIAKSVVVEDTPVVTTQVKIVTASKASAPPSLIIPASDSEPAVDPHTGLVSNRGSQPIRAGGTPTGPLTGTPGRTTPNTRKGGNSKVKLIALSVIGLLVIGFIAVKVISGAQVKKAHDRIALIASGAEPGTSDDLKMALQFLSDKETPIPVRRDSVAVLEKTDAADADQLILDALKSSGYTPLKLQLSEILSKRGVSSAFPDIVSAMDKSVVEEQKLAFLRLLRPLCKLSDLPTLLKSINGKHTAPVYRAYEDLVLSTIRKSDNPPTYTTQLFDLAQKATGDSRRSYFRILGSIGSADTLARLEKLFESGGDQAEQRDAMGALSNWPDQRVLPLLEGLIASSSDTIVKGAAKSAFVKNNLLPAPQTPQQIQARWKTAFDQVGNKKDASRFTTAVIDAPPSDPQKLLQLWARNPTYGAAAKRTLNYIDKSLNNLPTIGPGTELKGNRVRIQGSGKVSISADHGALTNWDTPKAWFVWSFRVSEAGDYQVEINQSYPLKATSEFEIYLNGSTLTGKSEFTGGPDQFKWIKANGSASLETDQIYTLVLKAGKQIQPRMMDVKAVKLVK